MLFMNIDVTKLKMELPSGSGEGSIDFDKKGLGEGKDPISLP